MFGVAGRPRRLPFNEERVALVARLRGAGAVSSSHGTDARSHRNALRLVSKHPHQLQAPATSPKPRPTARGQTTDRGRVEGAPRACERWGRPLAALAHLPAATAGARFAALRANAPTRSRPRVAPPTRPIPGLGPGLGRRRQRIASRGHGRAEGAGVLLQWNDPVETGARVGVVFQRRTRRPRSPVARSSRPWSVGTTETPRPRPKPRVPRSPGC